MPDQPPRVPPRPWLDRAIAQVAPEWAVRRERARVQLDVVNSYRGSIGTRLSTGWGWDQPYNNGSFRHRREVIEMRQRAQNVFANNPIAKSILQTEVTNVVADGFRLQSKATNAAGEADDAAKRWRAECEDKWGWWLGQADVRGMMDASELFARLYRSARRDGDGGLLLVDAGGFSKLQHIPANKISTPYGRYGDPTIIDGVEVNATLTPVAFHILDMDEYGNRNWTRVPANNFVFFCPEQDDDLAVRGQTCYATVFESLDQTSGFIDGVDTAARMATVFGLIFKSAQSASQVNGLPTMRNGEGHLQKGVTLENGMVRYIGENDDVVQVNPTQPMANANEWIRTKLRLIGMPFDMPLELGTHQRRGTAKSIGKSGSKSTFGRSPA